MKRACLFGIVALLTVCVCLLGVVSPVAMAADTAMSYASNPYAAFNLLAGSMVDRTVTGGGDKQVADWLKNQLTEMGYSTEVVSFEVQYNASGSMYETDTVTGTAYNVIATTASSDADAPLLVIGAPYDNERNLKVGGEPLGYEEALYSASSAATLLSIAARLYGHTTSYRVAFAFWGASYFGYKGVEVFLQENTAPLLGYIDLSFVAGGDDLNIYYDEIERTHGNYVDAWLLRYAAMQEEAIAVQHKPFDPGYTSPDVAGYPYGHVGLGANALFIQAGVPSIHLFGYNWAKHRETTRGADVNLTQNDSMSYVVSLYGDTALAARMKTAADMVTKLVLTDQDFAQSLSQAKQDGSVLGLASETAQKAFTYSLAGIVVLAVALAGVLLMRRSQKAGVPDFAVNSDFINGQQPDGDGGNTDDVFGTEPIAGDSNDVGGDSTPDKDDFDDIFGEH